MQCAALALPGQPPSRQLVLILCVVFFFRLCSGWCRVGAGLLAGCGGRRGERRDTLDRTPQHRNPHTGSY
uniref:Putative secreted protein n=1 Tax=Anopheles darlingi TaxID=43151 RepID=A0A2M4D551_ANODA